jgi:hypothetical protein
MRTIIYDIEILPNVFLAVFFNPETKNKLIIEKSNRMDNSHLLSGVMKDAYMVGYNNKMYDNIVCNYIMQEKPTTQEIYEWNNYIITQKDNPNYYDTISKYKYNDNYETIDLMTMLFSKKLRVSLKHLQVMLKWHNLLESEIPFDTWLTNDQIDIVLDYCHNDVDFTAYLYEWCKKDIDLRFSIKNQYNINVLSKDPVNTGVDILFSEYCRITNRDKRQVKELRSPAEKIILKNVISPKVKFINPKYKKIYDFFYNSIVTTDDSLQYDFNDGDLYLTYKKGGLHSKDSPGIIKPSENELLVDCDVSSLYPAIIINEGFYPKHLGKEFINVYKEVRDTRLIAKKAGNKLVADTLKLAVNGSYGNLSNSYSWLYDPVALFSVTTNGQLFLSMLCERLSNIGKIISVNTDGITIIIKKDNLNDYYAICKQWETDTCLELEYAFYKQIIRQDVNCYFAEFDNGYVKEKGRWLTYYKWDNDKPAKYAPDALNKGFWCPVVSIALRKYWINNIPIEQTIRNHPDILDYCMSQKVDRSYNIWHGKKNLVEDFIYGNLGNTGDSKMKGVTKQQQINRWYASTDGGFLYKERGNKYSHLLKDQGVTILNKCDSRNREDYKNIDYQFYIRECNKIIREVEPQQLTLF